MPSDKSTDRLELEVSVEAVACSCARGRACSGITARKTRKISPRAGDPPPLDLAVYSHPSIALRMELYSLCMEQIKCQKTETIQPQSEPRARPTVLSMCIKMMYGDWCMLQLYVLRAGECRRISLSSLVVATTIDIH